MRRLSDRGELALRARQPGLLADEPDDGICHCLPVRGRRHSYCDLAAARDTVPAFIQGDHVGRPLTEGGDSVQRTAALADGAVEEVRSSFVLAVRGEPVQTRPDGRGPVALGEANCLIQGTEIRRKTSYAARFRIYGRRY